MSEKEARSLHYSGGSIWVPWIDSLLHKRPPMIKTNYGFSWPVPPATCRNRDSSNNYLVIAGVALGCYQYIVMRKTFGLATGTIKKITDKPLSGCCHLFSRMLQVHPTRYVSTYYYDNKGLLEDKPEAQCSRNAS